MADLIQFFPFGTDEGGRRDTAKFLKGLAEVINVRKIEGLRDLGDRKIFICKQKLLGFFDAAMLTELHGGLAAVFLKEAAEIAFADAADSGDLGNALIAVLLKQLDAGEDIHPQPDFEKEIFIVVRELSTNLLHNMIV